VKSFRSRRFNKAFEKLGEEVQEIAREQYRKFAENPYGPGVDFHAIKGTRTKDIVAVNAGTHLEVQYRAWAVFDRKAQEVDWFWDRPPRGVRQHPEASLTPEKSDFTRRHRGTETTSSLCLCVSV